MYLYLLAEFITSGYKTIFIFSLSLISILFGILIIVTRNPVVSVLHLIGLFLSISLYLMLLGLYFIAISYLLVYIGAIAILFLFILMLINVRVSELLTEGLNSVSLATIVVLSFNFNVGGILPYHLQVSDAFYNYLIYISKAFTSLFYTGLETAMNKLALLHTAILETASVNSKTWDGSLVETNHITSIGNILYSNLSVLLIIISLVLLLAMVGTIVITLKRETSLTQANLESNLAAIAIFLIRYPTILFYSIFAIYFEMDYPFCLALIFSLFGLLSLHISVHLGYI